MNNDDWNARLRQHFADARAEDERRTPSFERLARVEAPRRVYSLRWGRLAVAAAALVLACVALTRLSASVRSIAMQPAPITPPSPVAQQHQAAQPTQPTDDERSWAKLSNWQCSTDAFLPASSGPWGSSVTTITDVWIGASAGVSDKVSSNGKEKS